MGTPLSLGCSEPLCRVPLALAALGEGGAAFLELQRVSRSPQSLGHPPRSSSSSSLRPFQTVGGHVEYWGQGPVQ